MRAESITPEHAKLPDEAMVRAGGAVGVQGGVENPADPDRLSAEAKRRLGSTDGDVANDAGGPRLGTPPSGLTIFDCQAQSDLIY